MSCCETMSNTSTILQCIDWWRHTLRSTDRINNNSTNCCTNTTHSTITQSKSHWPIQFLLCWRLFSIYSNDSVLILLSALLITSEYNLWLQSIRCHPFSHIFALCLQFPIILPVRYHIRPSVCCSVVQWAGSNNINCASALQPHSIPIIMFLNLCDVL